MVNEQDPTAEMAPVVLEKVGRRRRQRHRPWYRRVFRRLRKRSVIAVIATLAAIALAVVLMMWLIRVFTNFKVPEQ